MKKKLLIVLITVLLIFTGVFCAGAADKKLIDINNFTVNISDDTYKSGEAVTPNVHIYDHVNDKRLTQGTHFKVTYKNNKNVGIATAVVTGVEKKGYTGTVKLNYEVEPGLPHISYDPYYTTDTAFTFSWSKVEEATGYTVKISSSDSSYKKTFDTSKTSMTVKNLEPETSYSVIIETYTTVGDKKIKSRAGRGFNASTRSENYALKKYSEDEVSVVIDNVSYYLNRSMKYTYEGDKAIEEYSEYAASYIASGVVIGENEAVTDINVLAEVNGLPVTECYLNYTGENYEGFNPPESTNYPEVKRITLPTTLRKIGRYCFVLFPGVEELVIPEGVKEIDKGAFGNMTSLKKVYLPGSLEYIPSYAFKGCISLEKAVISSGVKEIGYRAFESLPNLKEVVIGEGLEKIAECAFIECKKLKNITLPESLVEIGMYAFARSGLKEITIPEGCIYVGSYVFSGCESLKKAIYNYSDKRPYYDIRKNTFEGCKNLGGVYFTALTTKLNTGKNAFKGCDKLKDIYYFGNKAQWQDVCMTGERASTYDKYQLHSCYDHVHSYIEIGQTHTCKKGAVVKLRCKCGDEYEYVLNNTNTHNYTSWRVVKKPTLKTKGKAERICTVCENKETKTLIHIGTATLKTQSKKYSYSTYDLPKPNVFVKDGNKSLKKGVHYKITGYKNNDKPGYGIATVKGVVKNGYYGTATIKYAIMPKGAYSLKAAKLTSSSVKLTWKNEESLNGYIIYLVDEVTGKETKIGTTDKLTYTVKNLEGKTNYKFKVLGYIIADGNKITGHYSTVKVKTK